MTRLCLPNSWRLGFCSSGKPVQFPISKTVAASYSSPHTATPWQGTIPCCPRGDASACTAQLPPETIQESRISPCRPICRHDWLEKMFPGKCLGQGNLPLSLTLFRQPFLSWGGLLKADHVCFWSRNTAFVLWFSSPQHYTQPSGGHSDLSSPWGKSVSPFVYIVCLSCVPQPWVWMQFL